MARQVGAPDQESSIDSNACAACATARETNRRAVAREIRSRARRLSRVVENEPRRTLTARDSVAANWRQTESAQIFMRQTTCFFAADW
jgi:hypothetical protein